MVKSYMLSLVVFGVVCGGCRHDEEKNTEAVGTVKVETVESYQNELTIAYPGKVKASSDVDLAFRVAGPLHRLPVEVGAFVKEGQVIAEIDPRDYKVQQEATEGEYKQIKAEAERVMELYKRGSVPVNDYDKAVYGLQQITAKYEAHKNALADTRMKAPFSGYIQKKYFNEHETVGAGMPVVSMISDGYFEVEADIPSSDYIRQNHFKSFVCTFDIFPGKEFPLSLIEITRKANLNQLYRVRLKLKNEKEMNIAAGMSVSVMIEYAPEENTLTLVPVTAVFEKEGEARVWVYDEAAACVRERKIVPGKILKTGQMMVSEGLVAGEKVVSAGVHNLKEGMKVKLLKPVSKTNVGGLL
ncbi:efflux RND transporter periplasmic adaptor subunit [Odoribacter lunatus]|uniref:efflux RND transporter periplasmic adaptor subunit n=1 Tax=Odoribacter lunatus TaxID=2941335 RepID=UPI00203F5139|nr:efflux RND transporter periplasmic adaptor subunit [Odoribacter lunatus]